MSKFKEGDIVLYQGREAKVIGLNVWGDGKGVKIDRGGNYGISTEYEESLELKTTQGPIREVRRREIVPGVYGRIEVKPWSSKPDTLVFGFTSSASGMADFMAVLTAEELREASHILAQMAEVMEEQG
jgi:hypothetical protein